MAGFADLHVHTNCSDGTFPPREVVRLAHERGLAAVGICDHDTVAGYAEACAAGQEFGIEVVPGVEISTEVTAGHQHILGYYLDPADPEISNALQTLKGARNDRMRQMIGKLRGIGIAVDEEALWARAGGGSIGRPHLASQLLAMGVVDSIHGAFDTLLGRGRPAFVPKVVLTAAQAIAMINRAGGVPVLAHPVHLRQDSDIHELIRLGIRGIEVYYPDHSPDDERRYLALARREGLLITGGSDCHGTAKDRIMLGTVRVPCTHVAALRRASGQGRKQ